MAKVSAIQLNEKRKKMASRLASKRKKIKDQIYKKDTSLEDRFALTMKLAKLPRNSARNRVRNRCVVTGRPRGYYRLFGLSRNLLRKLSGEGALPGVVKSSW